MLGIEQHTPANVTMHVDAAVTIGSLPPKGYLIFKAQFLEFPLTEWISSPLPLDATVDQMDLLLNSFPEE
jgi:hypothetical protein